MKAWEIIEAIDDPSGLVHPERHQTFASGDHPLGKNAAYPPHPAGGRAVNYPEHLATGQWQKILQKANQYLGFPLTRQNMGRVQQELIRAMGLIAEAEESHKEELEALALELVFELPEFRNAKAAFEQGRVKIDARLVDEMGGEEAGGDVPMAGMMNTDDEEAQAPLRPERTPADKEWLDKMIQRRHFTNAMIQGSAVTNNYSFEMGGRQLDAIQPGLRRAYGVLMVSTEIGYWMFPQSAVLAGAKAQMGVGMAKVGFDDENDEVDKILDDPNGDEQPGDERPQPGAGGDEQPQHRRLPKVTARGAMFPVLIQEIIKGLTELGSLPSLPRDPEERREVLSKTDLVDVESWSMMLGPKLWDQFIEATDAVNERELAMNLYHRIQTLDVDQFNDFMKEVLGKTPRGMQMLRQLAQRVKADMNQGEDMGESIRRIVQSVIS